MSRRLLETWHTDRSQRQYFIDDMESFAWVLLWASLEIQSAKLPVNGLASRWRRILRSLTTESGFDVKNSIGYQFGIADRGVESIPDELLLVLKKWLRLCVVFQRTDTELDLMETMERKESNIYRQMVDVVLRALPTAPDRW
jgi:hypothetical protein